MRIVDRGAKIVVVGDEPDTIVVSDVLGEMLDAVRRGHTPSRADMSYALREARSRRVDALGSVLGDVPAALRKDIHIKPRTRGQRAYLDAIRSCDITFSIGPAGTGKTYLAMAAAVSSLLNKEVNRLILTRPAVEAGENLGFLPGDLAQKINPYLRPLYDALYSMVEPERVQRLMDRGMIEVAPLAYMRGRTLSSAFVILDEAQNTTPAQMKMFLTRIGENSRAVVTGDVTQIDLPRHTRSGLLEARDVLRGIDGLAIVELTGADIVRHPLVQRIVDAYEAADAAGQEAADDSL